MTTNNLFYTADKKIPELLLPCPHCDDSWYYVSDNTYGANYENKGVRVECKCHKAWTIVDRYYKTKTVACKVWNDWVLEHHAND